MTQFITPPEVDNAAIDQAVNLLRDFFKSNEIPPPDAALVMMRLLAIQLTTKTKNLDRLSFAIDMHSELLILEIARIIRRESKSEATS